MIKNLILLCSCTILLANDAVVVPKEVSLDEAKEIAFHASHKLHEMMSENVKPKIEKDGILSGVQFCANESSSKIKELNKNLGNGVSLKRISLKNRDSNSYPIGDEKKILEAFDLIEQSNSFLPKEITQLTSDETYKVYIPVTISNKSCKTCHGEKEKMDSEVRKFLEEKYPNDKAFGYLSGQVRGAVVVTVKIKE